MGIHRLYEDGSWMREILFPNFTVLERVQLCGASIKNSKCVKYHQHPQQQAKPLCVVVVLRMVPRSCMAAVPILPFILHKIRPTFAIIRVQNDPQHSNKLYYRERVHSEKLLNFTPFTFKVYPTKHQIKKCLDRSSKIKSIHRIFTFIIP